MDKRLFAALMVQLAAVIKKYAPDFTQREVLASWYADLSDIPADKLQEACVYARRNMDEFPSIAWIRRKCKGTTLSDQEIGQDIASRIESAIGRFGYNSPNLAKDYIGAIGWEVVRQCGGWSHVCGIESMDQMPSHRKHWRDLGLIISKNYHGGGMNQAPALPEASFSATKYLELVKNSHG